MNTTRHETPAEVVARELAYWRDEQQLAAEFAEAMDYNRRSFYRALVQQEKTETLPMPRITWRDIALALIGR